MAEEKETKKEEVKTEEAEKKESVLIKTTADKEKPEEKAEEKPKEKQEEVKEEKKEETEAAEEKKEEKPKEPEKKVKKKVKVPKKFEKLVKEIEDLKVSDLAELVKVLEDKFGVAAVPQVAAAAPGAASRAAGAPEKQVYTIELTGVGDKKIEVIKVVRDVVGKGLKEAKDLVDAAASERQMLKENVKKEEAEEIKKKLVAAGASVELK